MVRLYGEKEEINGESVKKFFDKRAKKKFNNSLTITAFQEKEIVDKRQKEDFDVVLKNVDFKDKKILEIGCGFGRWAELFHENCAEYLGIDFSENLISMAQEKYKFENCHFQVMSILDININELIVKPPFDIIFIAGVILYLNDEDLKTMINEINEIVSDNKIIYIRESVSFLDSRLTLKDFYSNDLKSDYNAIYRTESELLSFFDEFDNITNIKSNKIHESSNEHTETGYEYFILS